MSKSLEELIRECAAAGCTHLTVYPVHSTDNKTVYWHARATPSTAHRYVHEIDTDIVAAITKVITLMPKAPKRAPSKKGMLDLTATVTEPPLVSDAAHDQMLAMQGMAEPPIDMDESAERLSRLATPEEETVTYHTTGRDPEVDAAVDIKIPKSEIKTGEPLSGMPPGTDPLDLHDAFGDMDQWLPKT